jgi:hypothetical protein
MAALQIGLFSLLALAGPSVEGDAANSGSGLLTLPGFLLERCGSLTLRALLHGEVWRLPASMIHSPGASATSA